MKRTCYAALLTAKADTHVSRGAPIIGRYRLLIANKYGSNSKRNEN